MLLYLLLIYRMAIRQQLLMNMLAYGSIRKNSMYKSPNIYWTYAHTIIIMSSYDKTVCSCILF
jgi:hypothetical protein